MIPCIKCSKNLKNTVFNLPNQICAGSNKCGRDLCHVRFTALTTIYKICFREKLFPNNNFVGQFFKCHFKNSYVKVGIVSYGEGCAAK